MNSQKRARNTVVIRTQKPINPIQVSFQWIQALVDLDPPEGLVDQLLHASKARAAQSNPLGSNFLILAIPRTLPGIH